MDHKVIGNTWPNKGLGSGTGRGLSALLLCLPLSPLVGCQNSTNGAPSPGELVQVWRCVSHQFEVAMDGHRARLSIVDQSRDLYRVASASGEKFQDDTLVFWVKGDEALVEQFGRRWPACQLDRGETLWARARADGMVFRGLGNEPGWLVEIWPDRIRYLGDYGNTEQRWPWSGEFSPDKRNRYSLDDEHWLEIRPEPCQDTMKGEDFPFRVRMQLADRRLEGCGRALQ